MARRTQMATQPAPTDNEFTDIVARSMPTTINADMVLTGMAKQALDRGMVTATSFDEALMHVFKEGIRLGREGAPKRAGRPRGLSNGVAVAGEANGSVGPIGSGGSALGSARGE